MKKLFTLRKERIARDRRLLPNTSHLPFKRGFSLIETVFYAAGLIVLLGVIVTFLFYMFDWYQNVTIAPRMDRLGVSMVDKIVKDLRSGTSINTSKSFFGTINSGVSFESKTSSGSLTKYYVWGNNRLVYQENNGTLTFLSPSGVNITRFLVNSTSTSISKGIRFDIDITYSTRKNGSLTRTYSGFAILRQSYE